MVFFIFLSKIGIQVQDVIIFGPFSQESKTKIYFKICVNLLKVYVVFLLNIKMKRLKI